MASYRRSRLGRRIACKSATADPPSRRVLVIRTDRSNFEREIWFPPEVDTVDISGLTSTLHQFGAEHVLRTISRGLAAQRVFNVNSHLCWTTLRSHGVNLAATLHTYAYLFCWDQTPSGLRVGYPAEFFAGTAANMTAFLTDTIYLRNELATIYQLPATLREDRIYQCSHRHRRHFGFPRSLGVF